MYVLVGRLSYTFEMFFMRMVHILLCQYWVFVSYNLILRAHGNIFQTNWSQQWPDDQLH